MAPQSPSADASVEYTTRPGRLLWTLAVFLLLSALYMATAETTSRISVDVASTLIPGHHLAQTGTLDVSELRGFLAQRGPSLQQYVEVGDGLYSTRTPGTIAVAAATYALLGAFGVDALSYAAAGLAAALLAAAAVALLFPLFDRLVDRRTALVAVLVAGVATTTWTVSANSLWPHAPTQLILVLAMTALVPERFGASGAAMGTGVLLRPHVAMAAAVIGLSTWRGEGRPDGAMRLILGTVLGAVIYMFYVRVVLNTWSPLGGYESTGLPGATGLNPLAFVKAAVFTLLHPRHGVAPYSPFVLILLLGVPAAWRVAPAWVRASALGGLGYLVVQIVANGYDAGDFYYGYRYQLEPLTLAAPLLLLAWREHVRPDRERRVIFGVALVLAIAMTIYGAVFEPLR